MVPVHLFSLAPSGYKLISPSGQFLHVPLLYLLGNYFVLLNLTEKRRLILSHHRETVEAIEHDQH